MTTTPHASLTLPELLSTYHDLTATTANFEQYLRLIHTFHAVAIDNCSLTLSELNALFRSTLATSTAYIPDQLMALDYHRAFGHVLILTSEHQPLNRMMLQELSATLMKHTGELLTTLTGTLDTRQGELRGNDLITGSKNWIDARKLPAALDALLRRINTEIDSVKTIRQIYDLSFRAHAQVLDLHPFGAGNGRVARLVTAYIQAYHKLPLSLVNVASKRDYLVALNQCRHHRTHQPVVAFMHEQLCQFLTCEIDRLTRQ